MVSCTQNYNIVRIICRDLQLNCDPDILELSDTISQPIYLHEKKNDLNVLKYLNSTLVKKKKIISGGYRDLLLRFYF